MSNQHQQLSLLPQPPAHRGGIPARFLISDDTKALGRRHLAELRAQLETRRLAELHRHDSAA